VETGSGSTGSGKRRGRETNKVVLPDGISVRREKSPPVHKVGYSGGGKRKKKKERGGLLFCARELAQGTIPVPLFL